MGIVTDIHAATCSKGRDIGWWNRVIQYKNEEYEEEIHRLVMDAVAVNDSIRREQPKKVFNKPNISFFNTNVDMHTDRDSLTNKLKEALYAYVCGGGHGR